MVAHRISTFPISTFNGSWIDEGRGKAKSRRNEKKRIAAKFLPAFSQTRRSARPSRFWYATKMLGPKITSRSQANSGRHMRTLATRQNTAFETGKVAAVRLPAKPSAGSQRAQ